MAVQAQFPLCGSQDRMDNGCGAGFSNFYYSHLYHHHQQQQQFPPQQQQLCVQNQQQFKNPNVCVDNSLLDSSTSSSSKRPSMPYSMSMAAYDQKQRQEIDYYIRLQNERLRLLLEQQRKQHLTSLLKRIESKALPLLRQKDEEIAQAVKRSTELQEFLKGLEVESQTWQRVAHENEAMVISLNNAIEQLKEKASCCFDNGGGGAEEAESCCDVNREEDDTQQRSRAVIVEDNIIKEEGQEEEERRARKKLMMLCKVCKSGNSCILFLPCRHLCSCKACEAFLDSCPVCQTPKKAIVEALVV